MKKSKVIALVLCVMMVAGALVLASCSGCPSDGNCSISVASVSKTQDGTGYTETIVNEFSCYSAGNASKGAVEYTTADLEAASNCAVSKAWNNTKYDANYYGSGYPGGYVPANGAECDC